MKKRILILLLTLALVLSACGNRSTLIMDQYNGMDYTINTADHTITLEGTICYYQIDTTGSGTEYTITYPDGAVYTATRSAGTSSGGGDALYDEEDRPNAVTIIDILEARNMGKKDPLPVIFGLVIVALGAFAVIKPQIIWRLRYGWRYRDAEPSDMGLVFTRLAGILILIPGLMLLLM